MKLQLETDIHKLLSLFALLCSDNYYFWLLE